MHEYENRPGLFAIQGDRQASASAFSGPERDGQGASATASHSSSRSGSHSLSSSTGQKNREPGTSLHVIV